jgi:hypothetical protein
VKRVTRNRDQGWGPRSDPYDALVSQVWALTNGLDDFEDDRVELPGPSMDDYDRYDVAYHSAIRRCNHQHIREMLWMREWQCLTCGKYFDKTTVPRRGMFG